MMPLDLSEENVTWVTLKLSGSTGALREEYIELNNWLLQILCTLGDLQIVVAELSD